jgi:hypothetical protein
MAKTVCRRNKGALLMDIQTGRISIWKQPGQMEPETVRRNGLYFYVNKKTGKRKKKKRCVLKQNALSSSP